MTKNISFDVFISYSHKDKKIAELVCSVLENDKIKCWYAPRDILPGENWSGAIIKGISSAKLFILIFTSSSNESTQVFKEVERADHRKIKMIPFRVEDKIPCEDLEYFISSCQWIDAFTHPIEEHVNDLLKAVRKIIPVPEPISYSKGAKYKWWMVIDEGDHGEDIKFECQSCNAVKTCDIIFNEYPPDICPVCSFDGEKKSNKSWFVTQSAGMGDRDIVCRKCRKLIFVSHYESDFEVPESCPTCHFSG